MCPQGKLNVLSNILSSLFRTIIGFVQIEQIFDSSARFGIPVSV